ncbi:MAG: XrtA system polysaccharide chain length determinant [Pseudomonadota bacterium]
MFDLSALPAPLLRYAVGLWRRRWLVVAAAWLTALVLWFGIWLIPDRYESRAQVFVKTGNILEDVVGDAVARPDYESRVEVMQRALLTRPNVEQVIRRSGFIDTIEASSELERRLKLQEAIKYVAGSIAIDSPQPMYFEIQYAFSDPVITSNVVDAVLDLFIEQDLGASLQENEEARRKLNEQIARFEERLSTKDQQVARFRQENAEELTIVAGNQRKREQLETDVARVGDELALARQRALTLRTVLASTDRTTTGDELGNLKVELAALRSQYNEDYPDIQGVKARIAELEAAGAGALPDNPLYIRTQNELRAAEDQIVAYEQRETRVKAELEALSFTFAQAPAVEAELQRIVRDYEQTQKRYEELLQSRDRLDLTTVLGPGLQGVDYEVLERPTVALKASFPPRFLLILASVIAAFGAGAAAALLVTHLDKTYTQTSELQSAFGLPVLGAISETPSARSKAARRRDFVRLAGACAAMVAVAGVYAYWEAFRLPSTVAVAAVPPQMPTTERL